jgi:hypothetical protein
MVGLSNEIKVMLPDDLLDGFLWAYGMLIMLWLVGMLTGSCAYSSYSSLKIKNAPWPEAWCLSSANDAKAEAKTWIRTYTKMCDLNGMLMMVY